MDLVKELRSKFTEDRFEFSKHAVDQTILREITVQEIREAIETGEVIEDYPDDKYGPKLFSIWLHKTAEATSHSMQLSFAFLDKSNHRLRS